MQRIYQLITLAVLTVASLLVFFSFTSCKQTKQVETKYIYTERVDTLTINGKTEYITRIDSVRIDCPEQPKTRYEVRNERKSKEDSLKYALKTLKEKNAFTIDSLNKVIRLTKIEKKVRKIEAKEVIKTTKSVNQKAFKWYHYILLIVALLIGILIGKFLSKWI